MEDENVVHFLEGKTIFVTGTSGYLAKVLVEKILRIQPNVKRLILLLRASDCKSATQRLHEEILGTELFKVLKTTWGAQFSSMTSQKVLPISGDMSQNNLGIHDPALRDEILGQVDIIVNSAATTRFDERYDVAMRTNTFGASNMLNFAKKCARLQVLLHVSTAYVCGERDGFIFEKPLCVGETLDGASRLDIEEDKMLVEETLNELKAENATPQVVATTMRKLGMQRARRHGWPNTYTFTKAMGEMQLVNLRESFPIIVVRPTIISSTYREPFPGWIEGFKTIDSIGVAYAKGKIKVFPGNPQTILDVIPGDMVVNAMIVAMMTHANQNCHVVYHLSSSKRNPLVMSDYRNYMYHYFHLHPLDSNNGKPLQVRRILLCSSLGTYRFCIAVYSFVTIKMMQLSNMILCQSIEKKVATLKRKADLLMRLVDLYKPYLFFNGIFDDFNAAKLETEVREGRVKETMFYFDPSEICWEDYFMNIHFPAVVRYLIK